MCESNMQYPPVAVRGNIKSTVKRVIVGQMELPPQPGHQIPDIERTGPLGFSS